MIPLSTLLKHYKRQDVRERIIEEAENKEIGVMFGLNTFGKRPDVLLHANDILDLVKKGVTSFHASEEIWNNPLNLSTALNQKEIREIRTGWDLLIDIDCKFLEYSKIAAEILIQALEHHEIENLSVKFSGNHGFHIAIPFQAFPEKIHEQEVRNIFPEGPRKIAFYLQQFIKEHLKNKILEHENINQIQEKTGMQINELVKNNQFDPYTILGIDTVLISHRHLYRMSYCFNEKSGLISIPIHKNKILSFDKEQAKPELVDTSIKFLDRTQKNNARRLLIQALDNQTQIDIQKQNNTKEQKIERTELLEATQPVPEQYFPPCINNILKGIKDGKKRSSFVLLNFLTICGWNYDKIEQYMLEWNKKNPEPLREGIIKSQISYHKRNKKKALPPNCFNKQYYMELGFCQPDNFCRKIKNPANYAVLKQKIIFSQQKENTAKDSKN